MCLTMNKLINFWRKVPKIGGFVNLPMNTKLNIETLY